MINMNKNNAYYVLRDILIIKLGKNNVFRVMLDNIKIFLALHCANCVNKGHIIINYFKKAVFFVQKANFKINQDLLFARIALLELMQIQKASIYVKNVYKEHIKMKKVKNNANSVFKELLTI